MRQRKLRNILIEPLVQIKIGVHLIILNILFGLASGLAFYYTINEYYEVVFNLLTLFKLPPEVSGGLKQEAIEIQQSAIMIMAGLCLVFVAFTCFIILRWSHRLFGPVAAINSQIQRCLKGEQGARVELRHSDEFKETGLLVNQLIERVDASERGDR